MFICRRPVGCQTEAVRMWQVILSKTWVSTQYYYQSFNFDSSFNHPYSLHLLVYQKFKIFHIQVLIGDWVLSGLRPIFWTMMSAQTMVRNFHWILITQVLLKIFLQLKCPHLLKDSRVIWKALAMQWYCAWCLCFT